jgi:uncharacterized protein
MAEKKIFARALLRAIHRDVGYLGVGLTLIYALSGLAVNHIGQWDPNFKDYDKTVEVGPIAGDDAAVAAAAAQRLGIDEKPREVYRAAPDQLDVLFAHRTLHVNPGSGHIHEEGQNPRFFLRLANWLHLNRGKKAWTYAADAYAIALTFLAISGLFMIKGKKGLLGRGMVLVLVGAAVPIAYVTLSGGP